MMLELPYSHVLECSGEYNKHSDKLCKIYEEKSSPANAAQYANQDMVIILNSIAEEAAEQKKKTAPSRA